ncbi:MAG: DUF1553 domain-containing protein [Planctomycetaceae bacterium]|nr:DUF1553 domain-containing protein [Planctomycetaceae bacterium]
MSDRVNTSDLRPVVQRIIFAIALSAAPMGVFGGQPAGIEVQPPQIELHGNFAEAQLLVRQKSSADSLKTAQDLTRAATYRCANPEIVQVGPSGQLLALTNGTTVIHVEHSGSKAEVAVSVSDVSDIPNVTFDGYVRPILSRLGCNAGACHASQFGKGDFVLSVVGFDPKLDHNSMVRDRFQRRVNLVQADESLLLMKPTMQVPHGGGQRLLKDSTAYQTLRAWIATGAAGPDAKAPAPVKITTWPRERIAEPGQQQQLRVVAEFDDDTTRDVTSWAKFDSTDDAVLSVTPEGLVTVEGRGQAPIMVRFEGQADIAMFVSPFGPAPELNDWTSENLIDVAAVQKFRELGIAPSDLCRDETFIRRAYLDAVGTLPTPVEVAAFVADQQLGKREQLVDALLGLTGDPEKDRFNDEYAALWTLKWSDLLQNSSKGQAADEQRMWAMHNWIRESFRVNKPFDQFVRELITAKGSIYASGPASYFKINSNSSDLAEVTAQLFLGVRLQCAKCHHHPFEKYSQADYYSFSAFFSRVGNKNSQEFGLFGRETVVMVKSSGDVRHPRTGELMKPSPLDGEPVDHELDRRIPLAAWLTSAANKDFARSVANRYVAYLLGRGLVEPVDDMRATNPPTNPAMLEQLADSFIASGFDLKQLIRIIMTSRLYQLDSQPTTANASDEKFYSHFKVKRLSAEPLLDAIDYVTQSQTKFKGLPRGTRAIELPDGEYPDYFLTTFGKPKRVSVCECERMPDENLGQALHTLNGDIVAGKISDKAGRIAALLASEKTDAEIITELYQVILCRQPTVRETETALSFLPQSTGRKEFFEDLTWALLNNKQFLFVY